MPDIITITEMTESFDALALLLAEVDLSAGKPKLVQQDFFDVPDIAELSEKLPIGMIQFTGAATLTQAQEARYNYMNIPVTLWYIVETPTNEIISEVLMSNAVGLANWFNHQTMGDNFDRVFIESMDWSISNDFNNICSDLEWNVVGVSISFTLVKKVLR
jgi:hypothetical protein